MVTAQDKARDARHGRAGALCASTIFVSAFLLFLVQPLIARQILPWFGGSAAVWTLCLVFFQVVLLLGYLYADRLSRWPLHIQGRVHAVLLLAACATLPIIPAAMWKPMTGDADPSFGVLAALAATIGLPYLAVCTTGPLVQSWVARLHAGDSVRQARVYRLFALSNLAALAALVIYPFVLEPAFAMRTQALAWSAAFALFAFLAVASAWTVERTLHDRRPEAGTAASPSPAPPPVPVPPPRLSDMLLWLALSALGTVSLLSVSTYITQDVASVPLLWIVPLALYLLTFVLCFDSGFWYRRWLFWPLVLVVAPALAWYLNTPYRNLPIATVIAMFCAALFVICMFCNGELVRARPAPAHLTRFYLAMALGGALGGLFTGIAAPMLFDDYWELPGSLAVPGLLLFWLARGRHSSRPLAWMSTATRVLGIIGALAVVTMMVESRRDANTNTLLRARNFYGVLKVRTHDLNDTAKASRRLVNGVIAHGEQLLAGDLRRIPTAYYGPLSGIGMALTTRRPAAQRIGVIGLGVGTLAAYGRSQDTLRFYEINPQVTRIAQSEFSYLADSAAKIEIAPGDARLVMQQELDAGQAQAFDVLLVDAFTGDAIPMHLMTREALALYARHVKPGGVIAFHISNRHLDLVPVVKRLADDAGFGMLRVAYDPPSNNTLEHPSDYVLVSPDPAFSNNADLAALGAIPVEAGEAPLWTDQHSNLLSALRPRGR